MCILPKFTKLPHTHTHTNKRSSGLDVLLDLSLYETKRGLHYVNVAAVMFCESAVYLENLADHGRKKHCLFYPP